MAEVTSLKPQEKVEVPELNIEDIKKYIAPGASDKELFMFINIAKSYGLNPFKREIHFVKYGNNPGQIIVGYETYLKRAERTDLLDGWDIKIVDMGKPTERAVITIYRKDRSHPFTWEVYRREFDKGQASWEVMPYFMLKKVAIAQGFRLAFPEDLGGMPYIPEEITDITSENLSSQKNNTSSDSITTVQLKKIHTLFSKLRISDREMRLSIVKDIIGRDINSSKELTKEEASLVIGELEKAVKEEAQVNQPTQNDQESLQTDQSIQEQEPTKE